MQIDSTTTGFSVWSNSWLSPTTIIALAGFIFVLYKYLQLQKIYNPSITFIELIHDSLGDHFVLKIATSFSGSIPKPIFYARRFYLNIFPLTKIKLSSDFRDNYNDEVRNGSKIPKTVFKDEDLFWVFIQNKIVAKGRYKIYAKTKLGCCSIKYNRPYNNLVEYLGLEQKHE